MEYGHQLTYKSVFNMYAIIHQLKTVHTLCGEILARNSRNLSQFLKILFGGGGGGRGAAL